MDGGVAMISPEMDTVGFGDVTVKGGDFFSEMYPYDSNVNETSRQINDVSSTARQKQQTDKQNNHSEGVAGQHRNVASPVKYTYKTPDQDRAVKSQDRNSENTPESGYPQAQGAPITSRNSSRSKRNSNNTPMLRRSKTMPLRVAMENENENEMILDEEQEATVQITPKRANTKIGLTKSTTSVSSDRLYHAKLMVDEAVKRGKVFSIIGPYPQIRRAMRRRGWIERFSSRLLAQQRSPRAHSPKRRPGSNDDDDGDDYDDNDGLDDELDSAEEKVPPWEEDGGIYAIMSRMVRDVPPTFIWSLRKDQVDFRYLRKAQIVNHHAKTGTFTTKVGLCTNLRNVQWYDSADSDSFYPRAYLITSDEDRQAFIEDFRLTACMSILKLLVKQHDELEAAERERELDPEHENEQTTQPAATAQKESKVTTRASQSSNAPPVKTRAPAVDTNTNANTKSPRKHNKDEKQAPKLKVSKPTQPISIPARAVELALSECQKYIRYRNNDDVDDLDNQSLSDAEWDQLLKWSYDFTHKSGTIQCSRSLVEDCRAIIEELKELHIQFAMDGTRNVWICKPGAKSRGRDIKCFDTLKEIINYTVTGNVTIAGQKETYVVQKYIENPLLVYNTKFDIRQWFLVTDWNPLTVYWYHDCYLRFCSQPFSLDDYDESIHLSNNSIQCKYTNAQTRDSKLPEENMWYSSQFDQYLRSKGYGEVWEDDIVPQMKSAVLKTLHCVQDLIDVRKNCFEMFGADFMIADDLHVQLIEINSAPCLAPSTLVTADLVEQAVDDLLRVVLDRRYDRNCNIGKWELLCREPSVAPPPYFGLHLVVEGREVRRMPEFGAPTSRPLLGESTSRLTQSVDLSKRSMSLGNMGVPVTAPAPTSSRVPTSNSETGSSQQPQPPLSASLLMHLQQQQPQLPLPAGTSLVNAFKATGIKRAGVSLGVPMNSENRQIARLGVVGLAAGKHSHTRRKKKVRDHDWLQLINHTQDCLDSAAATYANAYAKLSGEIDDFDSKAYLVRRGKSIVALSVQRSATTAGSGSGSGSAPGTAPVAVADQVKTMFNVPTKSNSDFFSDEDFPQRSVPVMPIGTYLPFRTSPFVHAGRSHNAVKRTIETSSPYWQLVARAAPVKLQYTHSNHSSRDPLAGKSREAAEKALNDDRARAEIQEIRQELTKRQPSTARCFSEPPPLCDLSESFEKPTLPFRSSAFNLRPTVYRYDEKSIDIGRFNKIEEEA